MTFQSCKMPQSEWCASITEIMFDGLLCCRQIFSEKKSSCTVNVRNKVAVTLLESGFHQISKITEQGELCLGGNRAGVKEKGEEGRIHELCTISSWGTTSCTTGRSAAFWHANLSSAVRSARLRNTFTLKSKYYGKKHHINPFLLSTTCRTLRVTFSQRLRCSHVDSPRASGLIKRTAALLQTPPLTNCVCVCAIGCLKTICYDYLLLIFELLSFMSQRHRDWGIAASNSVSPRYALLNTASSFLLILCVCEPPDLHTGILARHAEMRLFRFSR